MKWAGGKFKLIERIQSLFPSAGTSGKYIEPFVGAGAVALNIETTTTIINDVNPELINVWTILRLNPAELILQCKYLFCGKFNNANDYYQLRKRFNEFSTTDVRRAALFIYLNKHGFNGLCRFNRKGEFNVPYGKYKTVSFDPEHLWEISKKIQGWVILNQDYTHVMLTAGEGDIVYCDPPYVSDDQVKVGFTAYSKDAFTFKDQERLAISARGASNRGATVIVSNHDTEYTRDLYQRYGATLVLFEVQRNISCDGENRKKAHELMAVFPAPL